MVILLQPSAYAKELPEIKIVPKKLSINEFYEKYTAIGELKLTKSKDYFARASGRVDFISTHGGGAIAKGDIIMSIDKDIAQTSQLQAESMLHTAKSNYNRDLSLFKRKIISEEVLNQSKSALEKAKNEYARAIDIYEDMIIKAEDDGNIGVIKATVGDMVKMGDYLFSFTAKSNFYVFVELPETLHNKILLSDTVSAVGKANNFVSGKIIAISDYISNTGTITAKLIFPYSTHLLHGSFIENEITFNKHKSIGLPEKAVLKNNQGDFVYLITPENTVKQVFVTLGVRTNNMIELLSDELKEGDLIVLEGLTKVYDGAKVIIDKQYIN